MNLKPKNDTYEFRLVSALLTLVSTAFALSLIIAKISDLYNPNVDLRFIKTIFELNPDAFHPEPLERMQFVVGIVLLPFVLAIHYFLICKFLIAKAPQNWLVWLARILYPGLYITTILWFMLSKNCLFYTPDGFTLTQLTIVVFFISSVFLYQFLCDDQSILQNVWIRNTALWASEGLAFSSILLVCIFCIMDLNTITDSPIYTYHFNAVFHAVVQVFLGKELLADFNHQYGLYPHFIEPIFRVTGLSVLKFSILMSILMGISLVSIYSFMKSAIQQKIVAMLAFVSLIHYCYFFGRSIASQDYYYQYHPLRFLFPCMAIFLTYRYLSTTNRRLYYLSFVLYSTALLWNFDSGFVVFFSWLLLLLYTECSELNFRNMSRHIYLSGIIAFAIISVFILYMRMRYGQFPDFSGAFDYQKLFYMYGYYMLPMPPWHPWMMVLGIYASGLLHSIIQLMEKNVTTKSSMFFFLSILGIGLFSYYQGRSHDLCLLSVSYPAFIIVALYTDMLVKQVKTDNFIGDKINLTLTLFVLLYISSSLAYNLPGILSTINTRLKPLYTLQPTDVTRNADFVRQNTTPGEEVLILTQLSGVYSLAAQAAYPIKIPGTTELALKKDFSTISEYLDKRARKVVVDSYYAPFVIKSSKRLKISAVNPQKTMFVFEK